jgi:macrolide-specific efflux system membrane fusion protein
MFRNRKRKIYLGVIVILIISAVLVIRARQNRGASDTIKIVTPRLGSIQSFISTTGVVEPQNRLEIKPPINGRIEEIKVSEGEKVKIGQTLAWMSSTERAALLDAARAEGEESLKYWEQAYKATPLIAPINGEVIVRAVEPGQTVTSTEAVVVLSDRLIVKAQVDETDIGKVKLNQQAVISLDAYPEIKVEAKVDHISYESEVVNNVTIYEVDVLPERVPEVFRSGMSANVQIIEESKDSTLIIPLQAIKQDKEGSFVLLSRGEGKEPLKRRVRLGLSDEENVEVVSGIDEKDEILIVTQSYLPSQNSRSGGNPFMPSRPNRKR